MSRYLAIALLALGPHALASPSTSIRMITLPGPGSPHWSGYLVPERAVAVNGSQMLQTRGIVPPGFPQKLAAAYDRFEQQLGLVPTPLPATFLGLQRPDAFDTIIVEPSARRSDTALVFLHGYMGNVSLICWLVSRAADPLGVVTICPSVGVQGDWWSPEGARTLGATLRHLRHIGVPCPAHRRDCGPTRPRRVILAGLSNGARGASVLAPRFRRRLAGLILISGLSAGAASPRVPLLLLHGRRDPAVGEAAATRYVRRAGRQARHVRIASDHYILLTRESTVRAALGRWLAARIR